MRRGTRIKPKLHRTGSCTTSARPKTTQYDCEAPLPRPPKINVDNVNNGSGSVCEISTNNRKTLRALPRQLRPLGTRGRRQLNNLINNNLTFSDGCLFCKRLCHAHMLLHSLRHNALSLRRAAHRRREATVGSRNPTPFTQSHDPREPSSSLGNFPQSTPSSRGLSGAGGGLQTRLR